MQQFSIPPGGAVPVTIKIDTANCPAKIREDGIPLEIDYTSEAVPNDGKPPQPKVLGKLVTAPVYFGSASQSRGVAPWGRGLLAIYTLLKDLVWPVALLLLGAAFKMLETQAANYREYQETRRRWSWDRSQVDIARNHSDAESRRADRQQILNTLLPQYIGLVQEHYLPIARRMQTAGVEWTQVKALSQSVLKDPGAAGKRPESNPLLRFLCAILLMRRRVQHLGNTKGGIFFRSSVGEEIYDLCLGRFWQFCRVDADSDGFESAALLLEPDDTLPGAIRTLCGLPDPERDQMQKLGKSQHGETIFSLGVWDKFLNQLDGLSSEGWPGGCQKAMNLLRICEEVLIFECDRIFYQTETYDRLHPSQNEPGVSGWYFDPPKLELDGSMLEIPAGSDPKDESLPEGKVARYSKRRIYSLVRQYLRGIPGKCDTADMKGVFSLLEKQLPAETTSVSIDHV